ncbi:MAG: pyruvate:ferredoxin (flavodoxin) oxidoreductase [Kiritimatiellae bacterium]|nr:pyruvate:ferredoxin (flavodoxin) oxidoreductase [Kiritimatiellia bacterium]
MAKKIMVDGNTAAAQIAFACSEVAAIYPITPSSPMAETCDELAAQCKTNIWGSVPSIVEMESEGGAAGAVHGSLTTGSLTTTFTASQGLLLMIPNMYKIAGELAPTVFHVSARSLACQGLCIFGDQGDVMACRQTGFAMLCSNSVQEAHDMAMVAHASTLESKVPFLHFFDGFRTSHEVQKIEQIPTEVIREMIDDRFVADFRARALDPEHPTMRGTAQNPDINFQGRESCQKYYDATPAIVQKYMDKLAALTGRAYHLYDYVGASDAEYVCVAMGSGCDTLHETVDALVKEGKKVGLLKVHLYRPFSMVDFVKAIPSTVKVITVLDRTKEPGAIGDPLYLDVAAAIGQGLQDGTVSFKYPKLLAGRYGIGSKDFTPQMCANIYANMTKEKPLDRYVVGIVDDVSGRYILGDDSFVVPTGDRKECMFWGLGADGTVGANKNSIKIIGTYTENYAQGYFEYDSKKSGGVTISHLRFGSEMIRSPYFCNKADFTACHCFPYLEKYDMLKAAKKGSIFLLASPYPANEVWQHMPDEVEQAIIDKELKFYVINAAKIALENGMGTRTNTVLQTAFFKLSGILPEAEAIQKLKDYAEKSYAKKGMDVVEKNWKCIDAAASAIEKVDYPSAPAGKLKMPPAVSAEAPGFIKDVTAKMIAQKGNELPVSAIPDDGTWPTATTQWEKRNVAAFIPQWDPTVCIQCANCTAICSHAAIRIKVYNEESLAGAPETFKSADAKTPKIKALGSKVTVQVAPEDCMGCELCVVQCPMSKPKPVKQEDGTVKMMPNPKPALKMVPQIPLRQSEAANWKHFLSIPDVDPAKLDTKILLDSQLKRPLFEFSGACAGCGETPYVKLLTQLCGDRLLVANATGCSSIYGGNLPTTPYCQRNDGRGPAWSNSLFEDNAQFGLGMRVSTDKLQAYAFELVDKMLASEKAPENIKAILEKIKTIDQFDAKGQGVEAMRAAVAELKAALEAHECDCPTRKALLAVADNLVRKSVWILGGDGWAYDIGYGGLDHVLASGKNVKILVMDTEVYSNTGGQPSKATPTGAIAKFAASGKQQAKKNLGLMQMQYKNVYVAYVSMGTNPAATVKAFNEAENYNGPALIIAYAHCIEQGLATKTGPAHQKAAVDSVHFPLWRYNPEAQAEGKNGLTIDSRDNSATVSFAEKALSKDLGENRFKQLVKAVGQEKAVETLKRAENGFKENYKLLTELAQLPTL